jgi:hypothetical protein
MGFGNKGAVMVRLRIYDEPLCCLCCHIASGESPADALKRQADFLHICRTATFTEPSIDNPNFIVHAPLDHDITYVSVSVVNRCADEADYSAYSVQAFSAGLASGPD